MAYKAGLSLSEVNAVFQAGEVIAKIAVTVLWSTIAFRVDFSAYSKRQQDV